MKVVIYCGSKADKCIQASCVTAYSIKKNGGLPKDTKYILYSWHHEKIKENKYATTIFDEILPPPLQGIWHIVPNWNDQKHDIYARECWSKFISWINTPTDGEPVILSDWDIICLGDLNESIPKDGKLFAGRRSGKSGNKAASCNGGYYVKVEGFNESDIPIAMIQPLVNGTAYFYTKKVWNHVDEMGMCWALKQKGTDRFLDLGEKYNTIVKRYMNSHEKVGSDVCMLHFMGRAKPWNSYIPRYADAYDLWNNMLNEMKESVDAV